MCAAFRKFRVDDQSSFYHFQRACEQIQEGRGADAKQQRVHDFLRRYATDTHVATAMFAPGALRPALVLGPDAVATIAGALFNTSAETARRKLVTENGGAGEALAHFFGFNDRVAPRRRSMMTLRQAFEAWGRLAAAADPAACAAVLGGIVGSCTSADLLWLLRVAQHRLQLGLSDDEVLHALHASAPRAFARHRDLLAVCRLHETGQLPSADAPPSPTPARGGAAQARRGDGQDDEEGAEEEDEEQAEARQDRSEGGGDEDEEEEEEEEEEAEQEQVDDGAGAVPAARAAEPLVKPPGRAAAAERAAAPRVAARDRPPAARGGAAAGTVLDRGSWRCPNGCAEPGRASIPTCPGCACAFHPLLYRDARSPPCAVPQLPTKQPRTDTGAPASKRPRPGDGASRRKGSRRGDDESEGDDDDADENDSFIASDSDDSGPGSSSDEAGVDTRNILADGRARRAAAARVSYAEEAEDGSGGEAQLSSDDD